MDIDDKDRALIQWGLGLLKLQIDNESSQLDRIDALRTYFDRPPTPPLLVVKVSGGLVHGTVADAPMDVLVLDYDTDGTDKDLQRYPEMDGSVCHANEYIEAPLVDSMYARQLLRISGLESTTTACADVPMSSEVPSPRRS
ncbi:MAG: hypothetical protein ABIW82_16865 [Dokdonella sp.]